MSVVSDSFSEEERSLFRPFTRESLAVIQARIAEEHAKQKELEKKRAEGEIRYEDEDEDEGPQPDATLEQGLPLPVRLHGSFPPELSSTPLEDIDPFYHNQMTFVVVSKGKDIFRFSATNAMWILDPFNPIRRVAIYILVHPLFSLFIITTILVNCILMIMPTTPTVESTEVIFTGIYTFESAVKVMARGYILQPFTYLRDAWNWLDFVVIALAYVTMGIDLGNLAALRTFRVLRALKTVAIVPGLKTIVGAVIESVKNLRDVIILTMFSLSVFALMGLQIYMGVLTQKCIKNFPMDGSWGNLTHENWDRFMANETNWFYDEVKGEIPLCGNSSGAGQCKPGYTCLQGYGDNPNYGYTSFDTFGWAFLSAFRLMTQDYWENLYQLVLRSAGPWHMLFFIVIIFLGSFYLVNLILAIVAMSYDELQKKAEEEEAAEEEAIREAECKALEKQNRAEAKAAAQQAAEDAAAAAAGVIEGQTGFVKSPSDYSDHSYELFVGQEKGYDDNNKERISIRSEGLDSASLSLPGSPFNIRRGSRGSHQFTMRSNRRMGAPPSDRKPLVLSTYLDAQEHLPYADDSNAVTPMSEENGAMVVPLYYTNLAKDDDEEEEPTFRERFLETAIRIIDLLCVWDCCWLWLQIQKYVALVVFDPFVELFITLCIVVNTLFMALDHHDMDKDLDKALKSGNVYK